ncbi:DUF2130 domain-containing protein, partial [bacterium]|nr:DUF2130 domain-containing protein [bacterium]
AQEEKTAELAAKLKNRDAQVEQLRADHLKALQEKDALEQEKQNLKLDLQKQLSEQRAKIVADARAAVEAEQQLKLAEKDKKLADFEIKVAELQRKLEQGSQQLQGEVLELALQEQLTAEFSDDIIEEIPKGQNGADIRQRVFDKNHRECGKIIWESKRTKNFTAGWIPKLKNDLRAEKGDLAVLVTTAMPKDVTGEFAYYQGVWLCQPSLALFVSQLLRFNLIRVSFVVESQANKDEKIEALYRYLTGPEFVATIEAQLEVIANLRADLDKEKNALLKNYEKREQQILRLQHNVVGMYGGLQGVTNNALPAVKALELSD